MTRKMLLEWLINHVAIALGTAFSVALDLAISMMAMVTAGAWMAAEKFA